MTTRTVVEFAKHGPSSVLQLRTDAPLPPRKKKEVLVDNRATSVNPLDYKLRDGMAPDWLLGIKLPLVLGGDVAGVVLEADEGSAFKPGDRVWGLMPGSRGSYASVVALPEAALAQIPEGMSFEDAAACPLTGLTAWQGLEAAQVKAGDRVLVHAGAGGVGSFAIQLAKARGAWVATTCSGRNADLVRQLGADAVVDYTQQRFEEVFKDQPFDAVLDTIMRDGYEKRSLQVLKKSGTYVHYMADLGFGQMLVGFVKGALGLGPRYRGVMCTHNGAQLAQIGALYQEVKLRPVVAAVMPLAQAAVAQDQTKQGHNRGKIVLKIGS